MSAMRARLPLFLSLGLALGAASSGLAQQAAGLDTTPASSWHLGLTAGGTWYENAYFQGPSNVDTAWSTNGQATLTRTSRFRTGSFSLSGFGGVIYYPEIDDLNQPTYGGSFNLTWQPSRRTTLKLGQTYSRTNTRYLQATDSEGLPLPTSGADYATSTIGLEQRLSRYWQMELDGSFAYRRYDEAGLVGTEQVYGNVRIGRRVGPRGQVYLGYGYSSAWIADEPLRSHQMLLGGRKTPPERGTGFELAAGFGYVESTGTFYPSGRAGLTATGRKASLSLLYYRDFGQAYGYGRQMIGDIGSATLTWTPHRKLNFDAGYNYGYRRDPQDESYTINSWIASGGFSWEIGGGFDFGATYSYEHNTTEGLPVVEGGRATASLSYGVEWR